MKRRITTLALGVASVAALVAAPSAFAAYTSPKLQVQQAGNTTVIKAALSSDDDPTASVRIFVPAGTQLTTNQAPGTALGPVHALVKALALAGADLPFDGQVVVAAPGQISAAVQTACLGPGVAPLAVWVLALQAAGQAVPVPMFVVATGNAAAPAYLAVCLPPPDIPVAQGGAQFGAKLYSATLTISGVFSAVPLGAWISVWTPYSPGLGKVNLAGTVAAPAAIAPGAVTVNAKKLGLGAIVAGVVTQAGQGRGGAVVTISGGARASGLKKLGSVKAKANGSFSFRTRKGTFFKATTVAAPADAPPLCTQLAPLLTPFGSPPCVNPTVNGFTASSRTVKKK